MEINISIENLKFQKMLFIFNALNDGWSVSKRNNSYTFLKNHEGKQEIFSDSYLQNFITNNLNTNNLLHS
jgi:hypothetical protein